MSVRSQRSLDHFHDFSSKLLGLSIPNFIHFMVGDTALLLVRQLSWILISFSYHYCFIDGVYVSYIVADLLQATGEISGCGPDTGIL